MEESYIQSLKLGLTVDDENNWVKIDTTTYNDGVWRPDPIGQPSSHIFSLTISKDEDKINQYLSIFDDKIFQQDEKVRKRIKDWQDSITNSL